MRKNSTTKQKKITCVKNWLFFTVNVDASKTSQNEIMKLMTDSLEYGNDAIVEIHCVSGRAVG